MNNSEKEVLSNWYLHHTNELRCDCDDCKKLYDEALAKVLELGRRANKACNGFAAGRAKNKGSVKAANR